MTRFRSPTLALLVAASLGAGLSACGSGTIDPDRPPLQDYEPPPLDRIPSARPPGRI